MSPPNTQGYVRIDRPVHFWLGTAMVVAGTLGHLPMFIQAAAMDYRMVGMQMDLMMTIGMIAVIAGILVVAFSLWPKDRDKGERSVGTSSAPDLRAMDDMPLASVHWKLLAVLTVALIVDIMKPATLGFVIPGSAEEYGLTRAEAAWMPLGGIVGTMLGSVIWGYLGDVIGRRASILLAAIVFIGTSICGAMPVYAWNVVMCFMMGLGAGGMLPITFALMAETIPARYRPGLMVLIGGIGAIGGYLAASGAAAALEPLFGWRILWFVGLPTGVLLLVLNGYIPESPRYLMARGRYAEAQRIMRFFGIRAQSPSEETEAAVARMASVKRVVHIGALFKAPYQWLTAGLSVYALAWGLVNFGFLLWLPSNLRSMGMGVAASDILLAKSAFIAFPATALVAWLYHNWSTKSTMVLFALLTAISLAGFAVGGDDLSRYPVILGSLVVALLVSSSGAIALLSPYTVEVYPSYIRSTGAGWSAACGKGAGVAAISLALVGLAPGIVGAAFIAAVPTLAAAAIIARKGIETRGRSLDAIQTELGEESA